MIRRYDGIPRILGKVQYGVYHTKREVFYNIGREDIIKVDDPYTLCLGNEVRLKLKL